MADEKKERVIHTRVPESLERELKNTADTLGISVSNLVRTVLTQASSLVEDLVTEAAQSVRKGTAARAGAAREAPDPTLPEPTLLGWQDLTLNLNALCERCNAILPRGSKAAVAIFDAPGPRVFRCPACVEALAAEDEPRSGE